MPGVSSSNSAVAASFDEPMPDIGDVRGDGPKRATVAFAISPNSGSLSVDATTSVDAGGAAGAGVPVGGAAEPAPGAAEPAAGAAEPAAGVAETAAGGAAGVGEPAPVGGAAGLAAAAGFAGAADPVAAFAGAGAADPVAGGAGL